jgi:hypothetical protein
MRHFTEKTLADRLLGILDFKRPEIAATLFGLGGGNLKEACRHAETEHSRVVRTIQELHARGQLSPVIAARFAEIQVKPFRPANDNQLELDLEAKTKRG